MFDYLDVPLLVLSGLHGRKFVLARDLERVLGYRRVQLVSLITGKWAAAFREGVHYGYASKGQLESAVRRAGNPETRGFGSRNMVLYAPGVRLARELIDAGERNASLAQQVLARLTPEERKALGV